MDSYEEVMRRMKAQRKALGLSYQELAERTDINKSTLQRYETGSIQSIPVDKLEAIARALHMTPAELMGWTEEAPAEPPAPTGDLEELLEAMHKNPRLGVLFSRSAKMDEESVEAVLRIVELMHRENGL